MTSFRIFGVLAILTVAGNAFAEPDGERALQLFDKGRRLARDGRCAEAIAPFLESIRYAEGIGPLLNLGACYETIGKTASAYKYFLRAEEVAKQKSDKRRDEAAQRAHALEQDLSTILVRIPPILKNAEVHIDGETWPRENWNTAVPIDPGSHEIEVLAPPNPKQTETLLVRPKSDHLEWNAPVAVETPDEKRKSTVSTPHNKDEEPTSTQKTLGYVAGGAGIASLVISGIFGYMAIHQHSAATARCPTYPRCANEDRDYLDDVNSKAESAGNVATGTFLLGAALLGAGIVLVLTAPSHGGSTKAASWSRSNALLF